MSLKSDFDAVGSLNVMADQSNITALAATYQQLEVSEKKAMLALLQLTKENKQSMLTWVDMINSGHAFTKELILQKFSYLNLSEAQTENLKTMIAGISADKADAIVTKENIDLLMAQAVQQGICTTAEADNTKQAIINTAAKELYIPPGATYDKLLCGTRIMGGDVR